MLRFEQYLRNNYQFSEKDWDSIKDYAEPSFIRKNEYYLQQGKVCRKMGFIEEGVMRYCTVREDGEDLTCYFMSENDFIGDPESFSTHKPSELNIQALTDCTLICISYENMQNAFKACPRFASAIESVHRKVTMSLADQRTFLYNADAATKYRRFMQYYPHILQRVPLGYIASYLGITQQSLSRLRKQIS